ncbi:methyl-accepting chemotaxis sensory transducer with Cache sensor [Natranaerovirga pectinivora]|uniref:Methyl-accepting chemotaxis sensory transducer with Cache sensor n=1 Tax=Natranaerovirga pectinivora TaxID=682400 RepID=A0A4R3MIR2_9FIRM|nr:methyl-accepting chemotaxis protein [Natranaerovirga pectinivora]TCT13824.1 methyl-accepting chemotaxis sensory transducer with Cache sensor [Natranaerovirga pectinivora]
MKSKRKTTKLKFSNNIKLPKIKLPKINKRIKSPKLNLKKFKVKGIQFSSLSTQMVLLLLVTIVIPVMITAYISSSTSSKEMILQAKNQLAESNAKTSDYFSLMLRQIEVAQIQLLDDAVLNDFFVETQSNGRVGTAATLVTRRFTSLITANPFISSIYIISDNGHTVAAPSYINHNTDMNKLRQYDWYNRIVNEGGQIWIDNHSGIINVDTNDYISSVGNYFRFGRVRFVAIFDIDKRNFLRELENNSESDLNLSTFIITPDGNVISSEGIVENELFDLIKNKSTDQNHEVFIEPFNKENHIISYTQNQNGWIFINAVPEKDILGVINNMQLNLTLLAILFCIIAVSVGIIISLRMTKSMKELMSSMKKAEEGDLTIELFINRKDEIKTLSDTFNSMVKQIKEIVSTSQQVAIDVSDSTSHIASRTKQSNEISIEIQKAVESVAEGANEQSKEIEKSVTLVTELASKINLVVNDIKVINSDSDNVRKITDKGIETANILIAKNDEANAITEEVVNAMSELNKYVQDIEKIIRILNNISEETKLLSLNASIEAARVGEAGRGFAVVANEVSKLATQSSQSTKEIEAVIARILDQSKKSVEAVKKSEEINAQQYEAVHGSSNSFNDIKVSTNEFIQKLKGVLVYIEEMNSFKESVEESMYTMASVSQMTAASTEEVTASIEEQNSTLDEITNDILTLEEKAEELTKILKDFIVNK